MYRVTGDKFRRHDAGKRFLRCRSRKAVVRIVAERTGEDALTVYKKALDNVRPKLEVKPKRVGGATYQVPMEVNSRRATTLAIRWMVNFSRARKEKTMALRLANEIIDASNKVGASVKRREDLFKMAEANRAFSHYRF